MLNYFDKWNLDKLYKFLEFLNGLITKNASTIKSFLFDPKVCSAILIGLIAICILKNDFLFAILGIAFVILLYNFAFFYI